VTKLAIPKVSRTREDAIMAVMSTLVEKRIAPSLKLQGRRIASPSFEARMTSVTYGSSACLPASGSPVAPVP
jgi:hypothetical protein